MLKYASWMLPGITIPSKNQDACEGCGIYPKRVENGFKHPFCSKTCAQRPTFTSPKSASQALPLGASPYRHFTGQDLCEGCGQYPKNVEGGYIHPYCSKSCADKSLRSTSSRPPVTNGFPNLCLGCGQRPRAIEGGVQHTHCSRTCARTRPIGAGRARRNSLQNSPPPISEDPRRIKSSGPQHWQNPFSFPQARILFYHKHDPHYGFTNFSPHPVMFQGKVYPTSEHLFQSLKFQKHHPTIAEHIRTCSDSPRDVFHEAHRYQQDVRSDWHRVNIQKMDITLWHKFTQHLDLKAELLGTGDAELVEDSPQDPFWGVGHDGKGRNELGKALMRLRAKL